ncbi:hypothetical protein [Natronospira sp.]|uniref:hypothetical protein n=1 Tax=Natronospira sp. TaxID=2024970 RepID=UPI0038733943
MTLTDRELDHRLNALPREAAPPEGIWQAIERGIRRQSRHRVLSGLAVAASVLTLGLLVWLAPSPQSPEVEKQQWATLESASQALLQHSPAAIAEAFGGHSNPPGWETHRAAVLELEQAVAENPGDPLLLDLLIDARLREMQLMNRVEPEWRI